MIVMSELRSHGQREHKSYLFFVLFCCLYLLYSDLIVLYSQQVSQFLITKPTFFKTFPFYVPANLHIFVMPIKRFQI